MFRLVSSAVPGPGEAARFGALLTPQGKIIADFFIVPVPEAEGGGLILETARALVPDLSRKLALYKLRAAVEISDLSDGVVVRAGWDSAPAPDEGLVYLDPRHETMGWRAILDRTGADSAASEASQLAYHAHRIRCAVPEGGVDFAYSDSFPHEAMMDTFGGIDFSKGCYIGQEVVSRVHHRGTARTRIVPVRYPDGVGAEAGADVTAEDRVIGRAGSSVNGQGLMLVRTDKLAEAMANRLPLRAGGLPILPDPAFVATAVA